MNKISKKDFKILIDQIAVNFNAKATNYENIFEIIYQQASKFDRSILEKNGQQVLLTSTEDWNKKYGYRGYPSLVEWLEIFTGKKPLTDEEIKKKNKQYQESLNFFVFTITKWLEDKNLKVLFLNKYKQKEEEHLKEIINKYAKVKEELTDERIIKMGFWLKDKYLEDKEKFKQDLFNIANISINNPYLESTTLTLN
jgi:hypothetical protein